MVCKSLTNGELFIIVKIEFPNLGSWKIWNNLIKKKSNIVIVISLIFILSILSGCIGSEDGTSESISINSPVEDETVSSIITISGTADSEDLLEKVEVKIDDGQWQTAIGTINWSYSWDTTTVSEGFHTICVRSYDGESYSSIVSVNVNVDNILWGNAPDFTLTTFGGKIFTLSNYQGKVIVLDLMAVRCPPCEAQMSELNAVHEEKGEEIVIISIDVDRSETEQRVRQKFGDYVGTWTFAMDSYEANVGWKYQVQYIPTLVIIDTKGDVSYYNYGVHPKEILLEEINKASG